MRSNSSKSKTIGDSLRSISVLTSSLSSRSPLAPDSREEKRILGMCMQSVAQRLSEIDYRHFYLEGSPNRQENSDQQNQRCLHGAMKVGCHAILASGAGYVTEPSRRTSRYRKHSTRWSFT